MEKQIFKWYSNNGCSNSQIEMIEQQLKRKLPVQYNSFMTWSNGGEGSIGDNYLSLWKIEDLLQLNIDYEIQYYLSEEFLGIGTDGGGLCYGINMLNQKIFKISLGDLDLNEIIYIANSFSEFLGKAIYIDYSS